jgi:hypothetical protein
MKDEMDMLLKKGSYGVILKHYHVICLEGPGKTMG